MQNHVAGNLDADRRTVVLQMEYRVEYSEIFLVYLSVMIGIQYCFRSIAPTA